jgi:hypothetical protein
METPIYLITSDTDVTLPKVLEESFIAFISASGMPFAPQVKTEGERSHIHFLFLNKDLKPLVEEFMAKFEPDGYYTYESAVPNERVKHVERVATESGWDFFTRQQGADRTRICFIKTSSGVSVDELEERIELVS